MLRTQISSLEYPCNAKRKWRDPESTQMKNEDDQSDNDVTRLVL